MATMGGSYVWSDMCEGGRGGRRSAAGIWGEK